MKKHNTKLMVSFILLMTFLCCEKDKTINHYDIKFEKTYGGNIDEYGQDIIQVNEKEFLILGNTFINGNDNSDILLIKINQNADTLWTKLFGTKSHDFANKIIPANDDNFIIFGHSYDTENRILLIKINQHGEMIWQKNFAGNPVQMIKTNDGGYAILETIGNADPLIEYVYYNAAAAIIKLDADCNHIWTKTCDTFNIMNGLTSFIQNSINNYVLIGSSFDTVKLETDISMNITNVNGDPLFSKVIPMEGYQSPISVIEAINGGYIVMSKTDKSLDSEALLLMKIDDEANIVWQKRKPGMIYGNKIISLTNSYVIAGLQYENQSSPFVIYIGEMDLNGNINNLKINVEIYGDTGESIISISDRGLAIVGSTIRIGYGYFDVYFLALEY